MGMAIASATEPRAWIGVREGAAPHPMLSGGLGYPAIGQPTEGRYSALLIGATLSALGIAAFICDSSAIVRALTVAAEHALRAGRVRIVNGRLSTPRNCNGADLQAAIAAAAASDPGAAWPPARSVVNRNPADPDSVQVIDVIALPGQPEPTAREPRAVVVVLRGGEQNHAELELVLTRAFGLTAAECEVAARLASGALRETIAADRGASLQTVRSQIKSIFTKLNVRRERELVSMLAKIVQR